MSSRYRSALSGSAVVCNGFLLSSGHLRVREKRMSIEEWMDECLPAANVCPSTSCSKEIQYITFTAQVHSQTCLDQMEYISNRRPHRSSQNPQDEIRALVEAVSQDAQPQLNFALPVFKMQQIAP